MQQSSKQPNKKWRPVAFLSRSVTPAEGRYSQIEKEALAITWVCDRFAHYVIGKEFTIETDHKPLIPLLGSRPLDDLPSRIVRFHLCLMHFIFNIILVPGKQMYIADTLSCAPVEPAISDTDLLDEADVFIHATVSCLPATPQRLTDMARNSNTSWPHSRLRTPSCLLHIHH